VSTRCSGGNLRGALPGRTVRGRWLAEFQYGLANLFEIQPEFRSRVDGNAVGLVEQGEEKMLGPGRDIRGTGGPAVSFLHIWASRPCYLFV